jgi:hypothetical protein
MSAGRTVGSNCVQEPTRCVISEHVQLRRMFDYWGYERRTALRRRATQHTCGVHYHLAVACPSQEPAHSRPARRPSGLIIFPHLCVRNACPESPFMLSVLVCVGAVAAGLRLLEVLSG